MDARTPILILLGSLLAGLALSVLALTADDANYYNKHQDSTVDVHYLRWNSTAQAQYSYWIKLEYAPSRFSLGRTYAELAVGVICTVVGAAVAIGAWIARGTKTSQLKTSSKTAALATTSIAFIISLAITIYAYHPVMKFAINFKNSIPLPPTVSNPGKSAPTTYESPFDYTPEIWNCLIAPYVVEPAQARRLQGLCQEAKVAKYMMIPVVIVTALLVTALAWMVLRSRKAGAVEMEMQGGKEVDEVSIETAGEQTKN